MSDYDDIELDDDELAELYSDPDELTPEDVFNMVLMNKVTKKKVWIELEDKDGDRIDLADMMEELVNYIKDKLGSKEESQMTEQVMPLMSQSLVSGLARMIGIRPTAAYLANPDIRMSIIYMMMISFTLYKMVQVKGLTINTFEEDLTDEEIEEIERKSKANSVATMSSLLGLDPKEALSAMVNKGELTETDLEEMLGEIKKN